MSDRTRESSSHAPDGVVPSLGTQAGPSTTDRTFDEKAVAQILQRVASLEQKKRSAPTQLSVAEIEEIARESGLDPALVAQAVRDLDSHRQAQGSGRFTGAATVRTIERVVPGEIGPEDHERLAMEIRSALSGVSTYPAQVSTLGRSVTVSAGDRRVYTEVQVSPRGGQTVIRVTVNAERFARGLFGGLMGGVGLGMGTNALALIGTTLANSGASTPVVVGGAVAGLLGVVTSAWAGARAIFSTRVGRVHTAMDRLADRLEQHLRDHPPK
jgi:hypothetical protein